MKWSAKSDGPVDRFGFDLTPHPEPSTEGRQFDEQVKSAINAARFLGLTVGRKWEKAEIEISGVVYEKHKTPKGEPAESVTVTFTTVPE